MTADQPLGDEDMGTTDGRPPGTGCRGRHGRQSSGGSRRLPSVRGRGGRQDCRTLIRAGLWGGHNYRSPLREGRPSAHVPVGVAGGGTAADRLPVGAHGGGTPVTRYTSTRSHPGRGQGEACQRARIRRGEVWRPKQYVAGAHGNGATAEPPGVNQVGGGHECEPPLGS